MMVSRFGGVESLSFVFIVLFVFVFIYDFEMNFGVVQIKWLDNGQIEDSDECI